MKRNSSGVIFPDRLAQELSRNIFVVSILLFWSRFLLEHNFLYDSTNRDFHENSTFLENRQDASRKPVGCQQHILECVWVSGSDFRRVNFYLKNNTNSQIFRGMDVVFDAFAWVSDYYMINRINFGIIVARNERSRKRGLYESSRAVNSGWRFTARNKLIHTSLQILVFPKYIHIYIHIALCLSKYQLFHFISIRLSK